MGDALFAAIEKDAARLIAYIDARFGKQVAVEMLSQRSGIFRHALIKAPWSSPKRPFFAKRGYTVITEQQMMRAGRAADQF